MKRAVTAVLVVIVALVAATAMATNTPEPKKVIVCKYVGKPGTDERLQTGNNPISVSENAVPGFTGSFPHEFADAQGRSVAIRYATSNQDSGSIGECPVPENPPPFDQCPNIPGDQPEGTDCDEGPPPCTVNCEPPHPPCTVNCNPPPRVCPDGGPPTPGEGAYDPNDDCKRPPVPEVPPTVTTPPVTPPPVTPPVVPPPVVTPPPVVKPPAAKPPVVKTSSKPPVKLTGNPKVDDCKKTPNNLLKCKVGDKTIVVVPGSG